MFPPTINFLNQYTFFLLIVYLFAPAYNLSADEPNSINFTPKIFVNSSVSDMKYTLVDVRAIFTMRKNHWNDGKQIHVFVLHDNDPIHRQFIKKNFNMFPHQFRRIWDRLTFSGTGQAPNEVQSIKEMLDKISTIPGAIGYLNYSNGNTGLRELNYE